MPPGGIRAHIPSKRAVSDALDRVLIGIGTTILKKANERAGRMLNKLLPSGIRRWWFGRQLPTFRGGKNPFQLHLQNIATLKSVAADSSVKSVGMYQTTRRLV